MADPYLASDESVILATDRVGFRSLVLSALVMTDRRLLLIVAEGDSLSAEEILFSNLRSAEADTQAPDQPVLHLSYTTAERDVRRDRLTFLEKDGTFRDAECRQWADKLKEQIIPSLGGEIAAETGGPVPDSSPVASPVTPVPPVSQTGILTKHDRPSGLVFPTIPDLSDSDLGEQPPAARRPRGMIIAAAILVIAAVLAVLFFAPAFLPAGSGGIAVPAATASPAVPSGTQTMIPTTAATAAATVPASSEPQADVTVAPATPDATIAPAEVATAAVPQVPVPETGVWVNVICAGNFTGSVGVGAGMTPVAGTGSRFYQLATKTGTAKAIVQKVEGSSELLAVNIYRDGALVGHDATAIPFGEVNLQIDLTETSPGPATSAVTTAGP